MKRRILVLCVMFSVFCCGCKNQSEPLSESAYQLYFAAVPTQKHGAAVITQPWQGEGEPTPQQLLQALLAGPVIEGAVSPFPSGVSVVRCEKQTKPSGHVKVILSEQYSALTDISLTLADYCIVMTLTQLEQIESVEIQTQGGTGGYRSHPVLRRDEVKLPAVLP